MVRRHNEKVLRDLERGDLVEFPRGRYSHWGVYIGEEIYFLKPVNYIFYNW